MSQLLKYEGGQSPYGMQELNNLDGMVLESPADLFSGKTGYAPVVMPNGIISGGIVSAHTTNDKVSVTQALANQGGTQVTIASSASLSLTRATTKSFIVNSIVVNESGAFEVVLGTQGDNFVEVRGAAGGPAFIALGAIEVAQIRLSSSVAEVVEGSEIFSTPGLHKELANSPSYKILSQEGNVEFVQRLPAIHVGSASKKVYASFAEPVLVDIELASDFKPSEETFSLSSTEVYGTSFGSTSKALSASTFKTYMIDGITDDLAKLKGEKLWFGFWPDKYASAHFLEQGILGITRTFPVGSKVEADCTVAVERKGLEVAG